jgi:hypothetical protein
MRPKGLTVFELALFFANFFVGMLVAGWGWHRFGLAGLFLGFPCGFAILPVTLYLTMRIFAATRRSQ